MNSKNKEGKTRYLTSLELKNPENLSKEWLLMLLKEVNNGLATCVKLWFKTKINSEMV